MAPASFEKALETAWNSGRSFPRRKGLSRYSGGIAHSAGDAVLGGRPGAIETKGRRPISLLRFIAKQWGPATLSNLLLGTGRDVAGRDIAGRDIFGRGSLHGNLLNVGIQCARLSLSPPLGFGALLVFSCHLFAALLEGGPSTCAHKVLQKPK
jgi:hypothetical protein